MGRLRQEKTNSVNHINEKDRKRAYEKIKELTDQACDELERCINATKPCNFCVGGTPKKTNNSGKCLLCDGVGLVPDNDTRKGAREDILSRVAPAPKNIEMKVDDKRETEELVKRWEEKSPEDVRKALDVLRGNSIQIQAANE